MNKNFVVGQSNELIMAGRVYDLHNSFDFREFRLDNRSATLLFGPSSAGGESLPCVSVVFLGLNYLELAGAIWDSKCALLDQMGYKAPEDRDMDFLLIESQSKVDCHFVFMFDHSTYVRIGAERALLQELAR